MFYRAVEQKSPAVARRPERKAHALGSPSARQRYRSININISLNRLRGGVWLEIVVGLDFMAVTLLDSEPEALAHREE